MNKTKKNNLILNLVSLIVISILAFSFAQKELPNDTFYSIAIGNHISEYGIDGTDPFSWHSLPYTYPHWLYDSFLSIIYNNFGFTGIYVSTIFFSILLGVLLYYITSKISGNKIIALFFSSLSIIAISITLFARAMLISYIIFLLAFYWIERFLSTAKKRYAIGLFLLSVLLANIHNATWPFFFVLFLPSIAEYILSRFTISNNVLRKKQSLERKIQSLLKKDPNSSKLPSLKKQLEEKENYFIEEKKYQKKSYKITLDPSPNIKGLLFIMFFCILAAFLTPNGFSVFTYLFKTMQGNTTLYISEHQPLILFTSISFTAFLLIFLSILTFTDTKIKLRDFLLVGGLIFLSFYSQRQTYFAILLCTPIVAKLFHSFIAKHDKEDLNKLPSLIGSKLGILCILFITVMVAIPTILKRTQNQSLVNDELYPVAASNYILEHFDTSQIKLFNTYDTGAYLLFRGIPVYIDSRADLYAPEFNHSKDIFTEYISIYDLKTDYSEVFKSYGITHVLLPKESYLSKLIQKDIDYTTVYQDANFILFERS